MFCQNCGSKVMEGAAFCQNCGAKVVQNETEQQAKTMTNAVESTYANVNTAPQQNASGNAAPGQNGFNNAAPGQNGFNNTAPYQNAFSSTAPYQGGTKYGDTIKPYYCEQFDRIASGQKTKFNWAAFFFNGFNQLYNGCTKVFCRTYLPLLLIEFVLIVISSVAVVHFNFTLAFTVSRLSGIGMLCMIGLNILNGLNFNKWYYQDVIKNPGKKRSKKGLVIYIVCAIAAIIVVSVIPYLFQPSYEDLFGDLGSEDFLSDPYEDGEFAGLYTDDEAENAYQYSKEQGSVDDWGVAAADIIDSREIERAKQMIFEWFERHPLQQDIRIRFTNESAKDENGNGRYLKYELYVIEGIHGEFYVNPSTGDMIMDAVVDFNENWKTVDIPLDQWYLEYVWGWTDDSGYSTELLGEDLYVIRDATGSELLEYNTDRDAYMICNWDLQCFVEYDDGSTELAMEMLYGNMIGSYTYDESFEVDGEFVNMNYWLEVAWDGWTFEITEMWRGNTLLQEWVRPESLAGDTLTFGGHSLSYVPASDSSSGKDTIYLDGDRTMPFVRD